VRFFRKQQDESAQTFLQDLKNTCSLQLALKSTAPGLSVNTLCLVGIYD